MLLAQLRSWGSVSCPQILRFLVWSLTPLRFCVARRQDPPADSVVVQDAQTGFTFGQFASDNGLTFRIALPSPIPDPVPDTGYDSVIQVISPIAIGWAGLAWGGSMTYNPLTIVWRNGDDVTVTSRMAL